VGNLRRSVPQNPVLLALVDLFDQAHPERRQATQAKGFSDLVGKWRWEDYSYASRDAYTREQVGISYTDSGTLEVMPDGQFKRLHVHNHCSSAGTARCCLMTGSSEEGTVEKGMLVFQIQSGAHGVSKSQDGRKLRRHRRRWKVERLFAWWRCSYFKATKGLGT